MELVQELRVAGLGVQVLFGFLLSLPFTVRSCNSSHSQRNLYVVSLLLAALSTTLLGGPVAYHRLVFRRHKKGRLVRAANIMAIGGIAAVGLAVAAAVALIASFVYTRRSRTDHFSNDLLDIRGPLVHHSDGKPRWGLAESHPYSEGTAVRASSRRSIVCSMALVTGLPPTEQLGTSNHLLCEYPPHSGRSVPPVERMLI